MHEVSFVLPTLHLLLLLFSVTLEPILYIYLPCEKKVASHYTIIAQIDLNPFTFVKSPLTFAFFGEAGQTLALWISFRRNLINATRRDVFLI